VRDVAATVYWRFGRAGDAGLPPVDEADSWLALDEQRRARAFRVAKRREDWLVGRLNLKAQLGAVLVARRHERPSPASLLIDRLPSGAPVVRQLGHGAVADNAITGAGPGSGSLPLSVSNSHSHGAALAAAAWVDGLATSGRRAAIGADLEWVEPRSEGFVRDFLTDPERRYCATGGDERHLRANLVWSAKEAVLKVLQRGLSADTWWLTCLPGDDAGAGQPGSPRVRLIVEPDGGEWRPFSVWCDDRLGATGVEFAGAWRRIDGFVATLAVGLARI
jgi:phosphopantetheinyl transferase